MIPFIQCAMEKHQQTLLTDEACALSRRALASCLPSASRFSNADWTVKAVERAREFLKGDDDEYHNWWLTYRDSSVKRMSGQLDSSDAILTAFLRDRALPASYDMALARRSNAQFGNILISSAENMITRGKLSEARDRLRQW
ncbi:hypothetical protein BDW62DRAFT_202763 [Aspergillus aurantiobrunneus]